MLSFGYAEFRHIRIKRHLQAGSWPRALPIFGAFNVRNMTYISDIDSSLAEQRLAISLIDPSLMKSASSSVDQTVNLCTMRLIQKVSLVP
jgi:hypothetical protein